MHGYFIIYQVVTKVDVYGLRLADSAFVRKNLNQKRKK